MSEEQKRRLEQYRIGVREDGTVEGYVVETYLAHIYAMHHPNQYGYDIDFENKFVAFTIDDGGVDKVVRLPFELVQDMKKWIDEGPKLDGETDSGGWIASKVRGAR